MANLKELKNRIAAGWQKFWANERELTSKKRSLKSCLKSFDSVGSSSVLYGVGCLTLTMWVLQIANGSETVVETENI